MIAAATAEHRIVSQLVSDGSLTPIGLASMRRESEIGGLPLVEVLLSHGLTSESDVAKVYADMDGLRFVDLALPSEPRASASGATEPRPSAIGATEPRPSESGATEPRPSESGATEPRPSGSGSRHTPRQQAAPSRSWF